MTFIEEHKEPDEWTFSQFTSLITLQVDVSHGAECLVVETLVCQRASALVCRCDAKARAGCGSMRGIPLLQARHPEGFNRAHLNDRAKEGEKLTVFNLFSLLVWSGMDGWIHKEGLHFMS